MNINILKYSRNAALGLAFLATPVPLASLIAVLIFKTGLTAFYVAMGGMMLAAICLLVALAITCCIPDAKNHANALASSSNTTSVSAIGSTRAPSVANSPAARMNNTAEFNAERLPEAPDHEVGDAIELVPLLRRA